MLLLVTVQQGHTIDLGTIAHSQVGFLFRSTLLNYIYTFKGPTDLTGFWYPYQMFN